MVAAAQQMNGIQRRLGPKGPASGLFSNRVDQRPSYSATEEAATGTNIAVCVGSARHGRGRGFCRFGNIGGSGTSSSPSGGFRSGGSLSGRRFSSCGCSGDSRLRGRGGDGAVRSNEFDPEVRAVLKGDFFHPKNLGLFDALVVAELLHERNGVVQLISLAVSRAPVGASVNDHVRHFRFLPDCRPQRTRPAETPSIPDPVTIHHPSGRKLCPSDVVEAGHRGDQELVDKAASSEDPAMRAAALNALLRLEALDAGRWGRFAADPDPSVRRRAAELAPRLADALTSESSLLHLLDDTDEIVEVAAFALGEIGSAEGAALRHDTIQRLEDITANHSDALCRESAVAALGALHTGLATILNACDDKATVRRRAIIALAPFEGPEVEAALTRALDDRDWQVRQAAEDLLG